MSIKYLSNPCQNLGAGARSSRVDADISNWIIREYSGHSPMCVEISSATIKPVYEDRVDVKDKYRKFPVTPLEKPMLAPALVSACIMNRSRRTQSSFFRVMLCVNYQDLSFQIH